MAAEPQRSGNVETLAEGQGETPKHPSIGAVIAHVKAVGLEVSVVDSVPSDEASEVGRFARSKRPERV